VIACLRLPTYIWSISNLRGSELSFWIISENDTETTEQRMRQMLTI
jgi:hypothetical protein